MEVCQLNAFKIGNDRFSHFIDLDTDATHLGDDLGEIRFTVDSKAVLSDRAGKLGKFFIDSDKVWYFECVSGLSIPTPSKDLIKAEVFIFKHFLSI